MMRLKHSFALILLALTLNPVSLLANAGPRQDESSSKEPAESLRKENRTAESSPSKRKQDNPAATTKIKNSKHPIPIEIVESEYLNKTTKEDETYKKENFELQRKITDYTKQNLETQHDLTNYTLVLALVATFQVCVLIAQVCWNRAQTINQRVIERAYIKASPLPPGLRFNENTGSFWVRMRVKNSGSTPATVTAEFTDLEVVEMADPLPPPPSDITPRHPIRPFRAFLVKEDEFFYSQPRLFPMSIHDSVQTGNSRLLVFGFIDYIDQFGTRHRAGFGRYFMAGLGDGAENNLDMMTDPGYNYDRPRKKGEGRDWNEPI